MDVLDDGNEKGGDHSKDDGQDDGHDDKEHYEFESKFEEASIDAHNHLKQIVLQRESSLAHAKNHLQT